MPDLIVSTGDLILIFRVQYEYKWKIHKNKGMNGNLG